MKGCLLHSDDACQAFEDGAKYERERRRREDGTADTTGPVAPNATSVSGRNIGSEPNENPVAAALRDLASAIRETSMVTTTRPRSTCVLPDCRVCPSAR